MLDVWEGATDNNKTLMKEQKWVLFIALGKQYSLEYLKALYADHFSSIYKSHIILLVMQIITHHLWL